MANPDPPSARVHPTLPAKAKATVVACLGSSSTAGKGQAFDWIGELKRRSRNKHFCFYNFGVGGDLAYNALGRVDDVLACGPDKVVVWVGANDVLMSVSAKVRRFFQVFKRPPGDPSSEGFRETAHAIVRRLKDESSAKVALCSLFPIGEDLTSANPFQSELNRRTEEYSAIVRGVAHAEGVGYLPLYETMLAQIRVSPGPAFTAFRFFPFYRDAFRVLILGKTPDEVAQRNGWRFHTDGVHLNSRGGMIVADLVQGFIDG
jgi:lysophospholipase L1-like esterase